MFVVAMGQILLFMGRLSHLSSHDTALETSGCDFARVPLRRVLKGPRAMYASLKATYTAYERVTRDLPRFESILR